MARLVITIDGPAASGKSTVAKLVAEKLQITFLDTGAMYRAVTLAAMHKGVNMQNERELLDVLASSNFDFIAKAGKMVVSIDCKDVTDQIRQPEVTANSRYIASAPKVRRELVKMQRQFALKHQKMVTEGRDQGTVAFPDADVKFFLVAQPAERARRRQLELDAQGNHVSVEKLQSDIEARDKSDSSRAVGPLKPADGAIVIDTTNLTIEQVVSEVLTNIEKCSKED